MKWIIALLLFVQMSFAQTVASKLQDGLVRLDWDYPSGITFTGFKLYRSYYADTGPWSDTNIRINPKLRTFLFRVNFTTASAVHYCISAYDPNQESDKSNSVTVNRIWPSQTSTSTSIKVPISQMSLKQLVKIWSQ